MDRKKKSQKRHKVKLLFITGATSYFISFGILLAASECVSKFVHFQSKWLLLIMPATISIIPAIVSVAVVARKLKKPLGQKDLLPPKPVIPKLLLCYIVLFYLLMSIDNKVTWTTENAKELLTVSWTIFEISIMIFIVWDVVLEHLRKKIPKPQEFTDVNQHLHLILDKNSIAFETETSYISVTVLLINLFVLTSSTILVYLHSLAEKIITQIFLRSALLFSICTLTMLILDIFRLFKNKKDQIIKSSEVSKKEIDNTLIEIVANRRAEEVFRELGDTVALSDEDKEAIKKKYYELTKAAYFEMNKRR